MRALWHAFIHWNIDLRPLQWSQIYGLFIRNLRIRLLAVGDAFLYEDMQVGI